MERYDLMVIGGDAAGMSAASQARRVNETMSIGVFDKGQHVSYAACGMPYFIAGEIKDHESLIAIDRDEFVGKRNIRIHNDAEAIRVDFAARGATVRMEGKEREYEFGKLVIATGARAFRPPIPGAGDERVFYLRNLAQGIALRSFVVAAKPTRALIVGGGFIALEMAEAFTGLGIRTVILEREDAIALTMSPDVRARIMTTLGEHGVEVRTRAVIERIEPRGDGLRVMTDTGEIPADFIVISTGIVPSTEFLKGTPLAMTDRGAILVNEKSETNVPGVYAAGDCATVRHLITGRDVYMPLGSTANKQGRVAGLQAAGVTGEAFPGIVGSQFVKVFDLEVGKTGLNAADAAREGFGAESAFTVWNSRAGYCPRAQKILVGLTVEKSSRRVIGGEVAGTDGAALRCNVIATAVATGMRVEELAYLDLGYAPPFSPVWDPVNATAQKMVRR
jgi:CoA-dependent NAD(P)H sulfur oxidoreductase